MAVTAIPRTALLRAGAEEFVLVEEENTAKGARIRRKNMVPGRCSDDWVEVRSGGLLPGDRVVSLGSHELAGYFAKTDLRLSPEATRSLGVQIEPVAPHRVEDVVEVEGKVELPADRRAQVASTFAGTLVHVPVDRRQQVQAGDVVAGVFALELQSLQLELLKAHLETQLLDETLMRLRSIEAAVPRRRLLEMESQLRAGKLLHDSLRRKLLLAGLSDEQVLALVTRQQLVEAIPIRTPITGVVVTLDRVIGQGVKPGDALLTIHDSSSAFVLGYVPEGAASAARVGSEVRVRLASFSDVACMGKIVRIGRVLEGDQRSLSVWVELTARPPRPLLHGQLAVLTLIRSPASSAEPSSGPLAVRLSAVIHEGAKAHVFVEQEGRFDRRPVKLGRCDDQWIEVTDGLSLGERVVVHGGEELQAAYAGLLFRD